MSRDPLKLSVFILADSLVVDVYRATASFPASERVGLQSQIRRASISVAANIVEGCARPGLADYRKFIAIALASASEARYLLDLGQRLGFLAETEGAGIIARYTKVVRGLQTLVVALHRLQPEARSPRPEARG